MNVLMKSLPSTRRRFVKLFALGTAISSTFGKPWQATLLADVSPFTTGLLRIKLSDYPHLLQELGSVRIGVAPLADSTTPQGEIYPILINRGANAKFYALDTACKHAGCVVPTYDEAEGLIRCPCHGSGYDIDGKLLNGPATSGLNRYPIRFNGVDTLTVEVPSLGYQVHDSWVADGGLSRIKLQFPTLEFVEYELLHRAGIRQAWKAVPFALTATDVLEQKSLIGDGVPATIYAAGTGRVGFFSIAIKILDLSSL